MDDFNTEHNALVKWWEDSLDDLSYLDDDGEGHGESELELAEKELFNEYQKRLKELEEKHDITRT